jgi:hypothetical protein
MTSQQMCRAVCFMLTYSENNSFVPVCEGVDLGERDIVFEASSVFEDVVVRLEHVSAAQNDYRRSSYH